MTKRILSLLLAAMMVLGSIIVVSAAEDEIDYDVENAFAIDVLKDINVLQGYDEDDFALDAAIKRYEMSLFIARALTGKTKDTYWEGAKNETPFTDLDGFKYAGSTTWTYNHGIILGKDNKTFDPNGYITYQEAIAMILRAWADYYVDGGLKALKIDDAIHYPWRHIELVEFLELDEKVDPTTKYTDVLSRGAVAQLIFNLLTFDPTDDKWAGLLDYNTEGTMAEIEFGLTLSPAEGVLVEITSEADEETGILDNNIVEFNENGIKEVVGDIDGLTEDHFADFEVEIEEDVYYNIVYFTRVEVENNPITGEAIFGDDVETIVLSIEKVTVDDLVFTNVLGADAEYKLNTEITKKNDKGETTEMALVSITAGDKTYPVIGEDALAVRYMDLDYTYKTISGIGSYNDDDELVGVAKATVEAAVKALTPIYADLRVEDTNGDGEADTLTVVPYVFAAVYSEAETEKADDGKTTAWSFDNYAVVLLDKTQTTGTKFATLDKDGKAAEQTINGENGAAYIAKDSAKIAKEADVLDTGVISFFDIRKDKTNYITIDGVKYDYKYDALKGWSKDAGYYAVATSTDKLTTLYANNTIEDDELVEDGTTLKYVKGWVLDGKLVALITVTPDGEQTTTPETPDTKYAGIIDLVDFDEVYDDVSAEPQYFGEPFIKSVGGNYYLVINAVVDGYEIESVLVFLGEATEFKYVAGNGTQQKQIERWEDAENDTIVEGMDALYDLEGANAFYNVDGLGNYVLGTEEVTGENYVKYVGGSTFVDLKDKAPTIEGSIEYDMYFNSEDTIKYVKDGEDVYVDGIAKANTEWLFVDAEGQVGKFGIPEYTSSFETVAAYKNFGMIKKGDAIIVFVDDASVDSYGDFVLAADVDGFKYSMFTDALYALVDGETDVLNNYIRDGYYYFNVHSLFAGSALEIRVEEDSALAAELINIEKNEMYCIVAVTNDGNYTLLETYDYDNHAFAAIASLYGDDAFSDTFDGLATKAGLEEVIAKQYKLTASAARKMAANSKNLVYLVDDDSVVLTNGWPAVATENMAYTVFFTPATAKTAASYVVFIFTETGSLADVDDVLAQGGTIALTDNVELTAPLTITDDTVINLNGFSIEGVIAANGCELIINGTLDENGDLECAIVADADHAIDAVDAVVTLNNVAVNANYAGIIAQGESTINVNANSYVAGTVDTTSFCADGIRAYGETVVNVAKDATVVGTAGHGSGIEIYDEAVANIAAGATISGYVGVAVYGGTVETAGDITGEYALSITNTDTYNAGHGGDVAVTIKGGTVTGTVEAIEMYVEEEVTVTVEGGTISGAVIDHEANDVVVIEVTGDCTLVDVDQTEAEWDVAEGVTVTVETTAP